MRITRFSINEKGKIILTAVADGEYNFSIGDKFKLATKNSIFLFKVKSIEATNKNEIICNMKEIDSKKNSLSKYIIDPRYFIGKEIYK